MLSEGGHGHSALAQRKMIAKTCFSVFFLIVVVSVAATKPAAAEPAFVGMQVQGVSKAVAIALGHDKNEGVLVRDVYLGGAASNAVT